MSLANVEAVRRVYERWNDGRSLDIRDFHPDFQIRTPFTELEGVTYEGRAGYERWRRDVEESMQTDTFEGQEYLDLGDHVVAIGILHATARDTGIRTHARHAHLWSFRDGMPWRWTVYPDRQAALAALEAEGPAQR